MISVAMATFNGEKYIKRQVESVLENLSSEDELIVSDDGSTDKTIQILESFRDQRIKIFFGPKNGINKNFENAIIHCQGDYIFLCDQDDFWYRNKVSKVMAAFASKQCNLVVHDAIVKNEDGSILFPSFFEIRHMRTGIIKNIVRNCYHGCLMAFCASLKEKLVPIPTEGCLHDQWIGIISEMYGETFFLNEKLMEYIRHGDNASSFEHHLSITRQLSDRTKLVVNILKYRRMHSEEL